MTPIQGYWSDGRTSARIPARCRVSDSGVLRIESGVDGTLMCQAPESDVRVSPRLGNTPRYLTFKGGARFETDDNAAVDALPVRFERHPWMRGVHALESRLKYILICLIVVVTAGWAAARFGVPLTARLIASHLSTSVLHYAGGQTLQILDRRWLGPSELDDTLKEQVIQSFRPLLDDHPDIGLRVLFRKGGKIGANAFALPDGTVVFTDEMVRLSENNYELLAVLAHETGHVVFRHGLRSLVQDALISFAVLAVTGDVSGTSELFLGLPVLLTELAYSRAFEREADQYALDWLCSRGVSPVHFADLLRRLNDEQRRRARTRMGGGGGYLSTHPPIEERLFLFDPDHVEKPGMGGTEPATTWPKI